MMAAYCKLLTAAVAVAFAGTAHATTIFEDDFESHDIGDQITSQVPDVGEWGSTIAITPSQHTVQANPLGAGKVLRGFRPGGGGSGGFPTARTLTSAQPETIVTYTWDTFRPDAGSGGGFNFLYMGTTFFTNGTIQNNQISHEIRYNDGTGNIGTGVLTGFGGWERWEVVVTWSAEIGGKIFPTFDLFFERLDANNSQGILAKTQLANDIAFYTDGFDNNGLSHMRWLYGMNANASNTVENPVDSILYIDNLKITVVPVPEPASLGLLGAAGAALLGVRRRA